MNLYYVLWIPSLVPSALPEIIIEGPLEESLKDDPHLESCILRSEFDKKSCDIDVKYSLSASSDFLTIRFKCQHRTRSGFLAYEAELPDVDDAMCRTMRIRLHPSVYHFIKRHFHRHHFHDDENDSIISAWSSDAPIDPTQPKEANRLFKYYLVQYLEKLEQSSITLAAKYGELMKRTKVSRFKTFLKDAKKLRKDVRETAGEAQYAHALLSMSGIGTKSNLFGRLSSVIHDIETFRSKCEDLYTVNNNEYNNRLGIWGIYVGAAGILLTCSLEVGHCVRDNAAAAGEEQEKTEELRRLLYRADSLSMESRQALDRIKKLEP